MAMKIRLTRMGSKKKPFYRMVAVNSETRRDGRALDFLGYYNPMKEPNESRSTPPRSGNGWPRAPSPRTRFVRCWPRWASISPGLTVR
jgi:hypothetical protein